LVPAIAISESDRDQRTHFWKSVMKNESRDRRTFSLAAVGTLFLLGAVAPAIAQQSTAATAAAKWRPKDGTYAAPSADFKSHCADFGDLIVDLAKNSIGGNEWSCDVTRLTDTASGTLRIDMTCNDYNLADDLDPKDPAPENRKFKEVMYLKKVDDKSMIVRKSSNGKLDGSWRADYCPADEQRIYIEAMAHSAREKAERKAAEEQNKPNPWRPQDGVYATQGANFDERCLKAGDAIIRFSERVISDGNDRCNLTFIRDEQDDIRAFATCGQETSEPRQTGTDGHPAATPVTPETLILKKIDAKTFFLQKTKNGKFVDQGEQLAYCAERAQKLYAQQKAKP
jgi:uncharacterized protein with FMN-binding domain